MNGWVVAILVLHAIGLGSEIANHDKPKTGRHNANTSIVAFLLVMGLYYMAGLFN